QPSHRGYPGRARRRERSPVAKILRGTPLSTPPMSQPPPPQVISDLLHGHIGARCLHVVARLGVADALGDEPATVAALAARTGANADALERMLRLLCSYGVFAPSGDGIGHTPASRLLRADHPQSLRAYA